MLIVSTKDSILGHGDHGKVAELNGVTVAQVKYLWLRSKKNAIDRPCVGGRSEMTKKMMWSKKTIFPEDIRRLFKKQPCRKRKTYRNAAKTINISQQTVFRLKKGGIFRRHVSHLKPYLTDLNKLQRAEYCLQRLEVDNDEYQDLLDTIYIDEKWFIKSKDGETYILADDEEESA